ncbi:uncharacterized protein IUM83_19587 [Phytophthora cinnamomi]|uniref:uncharacterized protein n=1 Tax=Phytophthora cinnamomi TaxID=4785 RepID=UPI003559741B|nr:hypothetical protein IUM83_19587 [Phytophthora cinnamomi]
MTRSGKTRRFQRTVSDVIARNDDDGDDNANDDEEQKRDDHDEQARPRRDPGNDVDQAPAGGHQEQASAPSADETAPTVEDPDDEGTRDESSPEAPRMTTGAGSEESEGRAEPTPTMEVATLTTALQQLTAVVAGLQAQVISVTTRDEPLQPSQPTNDDRRRTTGNSMPMAAAVTTDEQTLVGVHQREMNRQPPVATETTSDTRMTAAMSERRGEAPRSATVDVAAAAMSGTTPSSEMTAMATALQQLTAMVAQLQPTSGGGQQPSNQRTTRRVARTTRAAAGPPDDEGSESSESSEDRPSSDDDVSDDDGDGGNDSSDDEPRGRRDRRERRGRRERRHESVKRSVKDLELPTFTPSPTVSVSTWIDRVDLALKGAEESGRGKWSDTALYFIMGNKLMDDAAKWWVNMNRRLSPRKRTWTNLKKALLRRYAEKLDKSAAEWRVSMRRMMPGETYADFAAGLRDVVGRNRVGERVLLAQFYRCLDKTTKKLVKQAPKPATLEEAVDKATDIDDPMDNVAQGMMNIGLPWATAPSPYLIPMAGTTGQTMVVPGIGGTGLPTAITGSTMATTNNGVVTQSEVGQVALFTNPQGIYNAWSGTWDPPPGHKWNGKYWYEPMKTERKRSTTAASKPAATKPQAKTKSKREPMVSSGDESDTRPRRKRFKAAVKQVAGDKDGGDARTTRNMSGGQNDGGQRGNTACFQCGQLGHWSTRCPNGSKCFACHKSGHYARTCPDAEAKARNDAYLQSRVRQVKASAENEERTQ